MSTSGLLIPEARFIRSNGTAVFVVPRGTPIEDARTVRYDPLVHKGHLKCPHCEADIRFREGSVSVRGSSEAGRRGHFALFPGGHHDAGCEVEKSPQYRRPLPIDKTKGFRIHINTSGYSDVFNEKSGVYDGGSLPPELRVREPISIKSAAELVTLLERAHARGEFDRINGSIVIFRNKSLSWQEFLVRPDRTGNGRVAALVDRLESPDSPHICAIVLDNQTPKQFSWDDREIEFRDVYMKRGHRRERARLFVSIPDARNTILNTAFSEAGSYLVLGMPTMRSYDTKKGPVHFLNIKVDRLDALTPFNPASLRKAAPEHADRGDKKTPDFRPPTP